MKLSKNHSEEDEQEAPATGHVVGTRSVSWVISLTISVWIAMGLVSYINFITPGDPAIPVA